ncbi:helix-turn-helix domain-containing protein [Streptomyces qinglanensis]|uniref:Helix-turn-helix domain-containing protein n=1 Tax=Streptomyces qinglanensis TaxID=943816 RepID=A0A1H9U3A3_9ACTN|nr:helix-turn-helix transcriptional regulator [Streptomyces qinglanensis]SES03985.1 Helix-turn-helix domain-containing protein [Streptomyces qinglanensis]
MLTPTSSSAENNLRAQVRAALIISGLSQAEAARRLDLSTKHLSQMLTGRATLTLSWADSLLSLCGMRVSVAVSLITDPRDIGDDGAAS